mmetsp:Transcript_17422/g.37632  ORF Transcript_17422/g.37632 Transcript_17422/m.37632 type:complete len:358 (+) Transcript_17422:73-1146(+)
MLLSLRRTLLHFRLGSPLSGRVFQSQRVVQCSSNRSIMGDIKPARDVWIDCDAGVDDAQGLILALCDPNTNVLGISCVHGNVGVDKVALNVARVLTACGREDVPLYVGAPEPLISPLRDATYFHGEDGLGDAPDVPPRPEEVTKGVDPGNGVLKMLEVVQQRRGNVTLVALGPLTNVALAVKLDPQLPSLVKELVIMGAAEAVGNTGPTAEFNFLCDPEAARLVLQKFPRSVIVSWECTEKHYVPWEVADAWFGLDTPKARFLAGINAKSYEKMKSPKRAAPGWVTCDPVAVAVAVQPGLIKAVRSVYCEVEVQGSGITRGMSVFDWRGSLGRPANVDLVTDIDIPAMLRMLEQSLL